MRRFHSQDGWSFERLEDGSVKVEWDDPNEFVRADTILDPEVWASVVASMSTEGETRESWQAALDRQKP